MRPRLGEDLAGGSAGRPGRAEIATDPMGVEVSDCFVMLRPREAWRYRPKEALVEAIGPRITGEAGDGPCARGDCG